MFVDAFVCVSCAVGARVCVCVCLYLCVCVCVCTCVCVYKWSGGKQKQRVEGYMQNNGWMEGSEAIVERSPGNQKGVGDPEEGVMQ